jgi:hypothetical protein
MMCQQEEQDSPAKQQVRDMINKHDPDLLIKQTMSPRYNTMQEETRQSMEHLTITQQRPKSPGAMSSISSKYKSTISLHELGLDSYPYPDMPESSRLSRKE